jgi:hypothetical protein
MPFKTGVWRGKKSAKIVRKRGSFGAEVGDHFGHPQAAQVTKSKLAFAN